jgi:hypothetical protein
LFSKSVLRSVMTVLVLTLSLAPAVAQAGGRGPAKGESKPAASRVQERGGVLQDLWRGLTSLFEKGGASIDPSGQQPGLGTSNSGTDNGGSIDPSGTP